MAAARPARPPRRRRHHSLGLRRADRSRPQVRLSLTGVVPEHPAVTDHLAAVPIWNGDTNFAYGTCMVVAEANSAIMTWRFLEGLDVSVSDEAIYALYRASGNPNFDPVTGAGDNGCDPTVAMAALVREGIDLTMPDNSTERHKPLCYGEVLVPPYDGLHATTAIFGGGIGAFDLDQAQDSQVNAGVWDFVEGSQPWGGHACFCGAYTSATGPHEVDVALITWEQRVGTTPGFVNHQLWGFYAPVWEPLWDSPGFMAGVDRAQLAADFEAVTGRDFPVPVPPPPLPPEPPPAPEPEPSEALAAYLSDERLGRWAGRKGVPWTDTTYAKHHYLALRESEGG